MKDIKNKMKNKLTILCSLMIIVAFLFGCTNQKKLDKEEIEIVTKLINKILFENEISPIIIDEVYQKYQKDSITDPLVIDSLVRADVTNRKYYVTFSDTLFPIDRKGDLFKETMSFLVYFPLDREDTVARKINIKELDIRKNLIIVPNKPSDNYNVYLGSFEISRVVFNRNLKRALVYYKVDKDGHHFESSMKEFIKENDVWEVKENKFPK